MTFSIDIANMLIQRPTPENANNFVAQIINEDGLFSDQEDTLFDYKDEFPHSMSDEYFHGIVRLIFAFFNTYGGVVVLGVHDTKRTGGHNKKNVKIERLNNRLRELCGISINVIHINVPSDNSKKRCDVDLLIVPKRKSNISPVRLLSSLGKYRKDIVWMRKGHEVLEAESKDVGFLFSPRSNSEEETETIPSFQPSNPSTIKTFVGRIEILSELLNWVSSEDEPRKFLHGKGGSGKSTIAYEFAKIIKNYGSEISLLNGKKFERVVFLSAKEKALKPATQKIHDVDSDFSSFEQLLSAICSACSYSSELNYSDLKQSKLEQYLKEIFEYESILLVIDDVDTLTTKGEVAGFSLLNKLCLRSPHLVRVLYTQRNPPDEIENAISVPGFTTENGYLEFVQYCCDLFKVSLPDDEILKGPLFNDSEGIPLIIETITGLRKTCGSWGKALELFHEHPGDEARKYLFEREYQSLPKDNNARHVLAAIAEFKKPIANEDLALIITIGDSAISACIGQLVGFFLSTEESQDGKTRYFINRVTEQFVKERASKLDFAQKIFERVKVYKAGVQKKPKEIYILEQNIERCKARSDNNGLKSLFDVDYPAKITENPQFRKVRALALQNIDRNDSYLIRSDFQFCLDMKFEDVELMRGWIKFEKIQNSGFIERLKICNAVVAGKSYGERTKAEFKSRRASIYYHRAKEISLADAYKDYERALFDHGDAYEFFYQHKDNLSQQNEFFRSAAFSLFICGVKLAFDKEIVASFRELSKRCKYLYDPVTDPLKEIIQLLKKPADVSTEKRRRGELNRLKTDFNRGEIKFEREEVKHSFLRLIEKD